jgi:hypothetical protein
MLVFRNDANNSRDASYIRHHIISMDAMSVGNSKHGSSGTIPAKKKNTQQQGYKLDSRVANSSKSNNRANSSCKDSTKITNTATAVMSWQSKAIRSNCSDEAATVTPTTARVHCSLKSNHQ